LSAREVEDILNFSNANTRDSEIEEGFQLLYHAVTNSSLVSLLEILCL